MIALDTSVLAYAVNRFAPEHARAAQTVEELANGDQPWALPWTVVHEFLRLVTHPHAAARALRPSDAWAYALGMHRAQRCLISERKPCRTFRQA